MSSKTPIQLTSLRAFNRHYNRKSGFVLIAVLIILALVTTLAVIGAIMTQVERRAAGNNAKIEQARLNALFGLNAALAQLQREAGPDQRITSRAEILDASPSDAAITGVTQPYWSGVWKTGTASLDITNSGTPQRQTSFGALTPSLAQKSSSASWLVSNPDPTTAIDPIGWTGTTTGANPNAVVLAKNVGSTAVSVTVPLVEIKTAAANGNLPAQSRIGKYAYWASDEGVKAKANLFDSTLGKDPVGNRAENQLHFLAPQATELRKGLLGTQNTTELRADAGIMKVTTLQSLGMINGVTGLSGSDAAKYFCDATTYSYGVLSDVRNGGLKKDLTAAFENPTTFNTFATNYGLGTSSLYRSATSLGITIPGKDTGVTPPMDGLPWAPLFFFYNTYKGSMPPYYPATPVGPVGVGNAASLPYTAAPRINSVKMGGNNYVKMSGMMPVLMAYRVDCALASFQSGGMWKLRVHYFPQVVLHNPYSVQLNASGFHLWRQFNAFGGCKATITVSGAASNPPQFGINQSTNANGRLILRPNIADSMPMEPGETRVFALEADAQMLNLPKAIDFTDLVSSPNMSPDYSQYATVPGTSGDWPGTPDGNAMVSVTLSSRSLSANAVENLVFPTGIKWPDNEGNNRYVNGNPPTTVSATSTLWTPRAISTMTSPARLIGVYIRVKGTRTSSSLYTYSNATNALPMFMGNGSSINTFDDMRSGDFQEIYLSPLGVPYQNGQADVQIAPSGTHWETSCIDESTGVAAPGAQRILRDAPGQPLVSLGQFMHMPALAFWTTGAYQRLGFGSMFVVGSLPEPTIPTTSTLLDYTQTKDVFLDDSFLANQALFDSYFFSTMPPSSLNAAGTTYPAAWTAFNTANSSTRLTDATKPLLNARMKPVQTRGDWPLLADLRTPEKAAANLMLDGAFNINSTSIEAWKALLSSLSGNQLQVWNSTSKALSLFDPGSESPIPRFWSGTSVASPNQPWSGMRVLSDAEVTELAGRIVEQVKTRGPFLSMGDFLNRRLGASGPLTLKGALQAARFCDGWCFDVSPVATGF